MQITKAASVTIQNSSFLIYTYPAKISYFNFITVTTETSSFSIHTYPVTVRVRARYSYFKFITVTTQNSSFSIYTYPVTVRVRAKLFQLHYNYDTKLFFFDLHISSDS